MRWLLALLCCWSVVGSAGEPAPAAVVHIIQPYRVGNAWVFDDAARELKAEPFVGGATEVIDLLVKDLPNTKDGFRLSFSAQPITGHQMHLTWHRGENKGNWYRIAGTKQEGWLCPSLYKYFAQAPAHLYLKAEALPAKPVAP